MSILLFVIVLGILVVSHEFGHFLFAKLFKMKVEEFGFGFPPRMFGKRIGETLYSINWIPFGGFVKIYGEDPAGGGQIEAPAENIELPKTQGSFAAAPKWQQAAVVVAGVVFNFILAWGLISLGYVVGFPTSVEAAPAGIEVEEVRLLVTDVGKGTPAERAGLRVGDELVGFSRGATELMELTPDAAREYIRASDAPLAVSYKRGDGAIQNTEVTPEQGIVPGHGAIGIAMDRVGIVHLSFFAAIREGFLTACNLTAATAMALFAIVQGLFVGSAPSGVAGPVGMIGLVGDASVMGLSYLISLVALISVNLAIMNLVPFPALDGGRLVFILIEAIRGKDIPPRVAHSVNAAGFFILLFLMALLTYGDVMRLIRG